MDPIVPGEQPGLLFSQVPREPRRIAPGVAHLPGRLSLERQAALVTEAREIARTLVGTPLAMQPLAVGTGHTSAHIMSLGWHWTTRPYGYVRSLAGVAVPPVPGSWEVLARQLLIDAARFAPELTPGADGSFRAEAALVNFYPEAARMGLQVDANEPSDAPVVSLSIGDEAVFRIAGIEAPRRPWDDVTLMSGDVIVFGSPARRAYHGVPRVRTGTAPTGCGLSEGRINITLRQVESTQRGDTR